MSKKNKTNQSEENKKHPLPIYDKKDDIYNKEKEVPLEEVENPHPTPSTKMDGKGEDLDVPGAELDDAEEAIGEEDEENNYYSLGGDRHEELEEDNQ